MAEQQNDRPGGNGGDGGQPALNPDGVEKVLDQFEPLIDAMVDAARGDRDAADTLDEWIASMDAKDEWKDLAGRLRKIAAGDRDAAALLKGTDVVDGLLVRAILDAIAAEHPAEQAHAGAGAADDELASLDEFLGLVRYACSADAPEMLAGQIRGAATNMRDADGVTDATHTLGTAILAILDGDRDPDLSGLPEAHANHVRLLIEKLVADETPDPE